MKWAKYDEFSDFHTPKFGVKCPHKGAAGAFSKNGCPLTLPSHRLAATDDDGFGVFEN